MGKELQLEAYGKLRKMEDWAPCKKNIFLDWEYLPFSSYLGLGECVIMCVCVCASAFTLFFCVSVSEGNVMKRSLFFC